MKNNITEYDKLKEYILYELRSNVTKEADNIGISRQYLCNICNNKIIPGGRAAFGIQKWSHGKFLAVDLMNIKL